MTGEPEKREVDPATLCARADDFPASSTTPVNPPIQLSSVYHVADLRQIDALYDRVESGYIYARDGHPNAAQLASKLARLEGAEAGLVCASGMAAESALILAATGQGEEIALSEGLYGRTVALVGRELSRFGVMHRFFDATRPETLRAVLNPRTRLVFAETLSNPLVRLADIEGLANIIKSANSDAMLAIDHTFAPLLCYPLALGADAVIHSLTKLIGGHSDVTLGFVAGSKSLIERTGVVASTFGMTGNPFESWLTLRGLATLSVRSERACFNALGLSERLSRHKKVNAVHYPGLPGHPDHDLAKRELTRGFGAMLTIDLGGRDSADLFIKSLGHIPFAPSLGDVATTLSHPATTSHRGQSPELWARQGITPGLVRLSIGLENVDDLWADFQQALDRL